MTLARRRRYIPKKPRLGLGIWDRVVAQFEWVRLDTGLQCASAYVCLAGPLDREKRTCS